MTETGSLLRPAAIAVCLMCFVVHPARAQDGPRPLPNPPTSPSLMSRFDFHLAADSLSNHDPRFVWDTRFGGDFDLVDYVKGRVTLLADYEAVLGDEFRAFDPNQGNYTLEAAGSIRVGGVEVFGVLHHISRHFGDRPKVLPIAWNVAQARALKRFNANGTTIDVRLDAGKVVARATVDYDWAGDVNVFVVHPINSHLAVFGRGYAETIGVSKKVAGRSRQAGGRVEAGLRLPGAGGAIDLFGGYERVIDADAIQQLPLHWGFLGFRMVTK